MEPQTFVIENESELDELCGRLIAFAGNCRIWIFSGEMGAGKTTFIRHLCALLGVRQQVNSPTFSIINEYMAGGERICHFDFYRIESDREAIDTGCEEYFYSGSLCLIEWPEKILNLVPRPFVKIDIENTGTKRKITFTHGR